MGNPDQFGKQAMILRRHRASAALTILMVFGVAAAVYYKSQELGLDGASSPLFASVDIAKMPAPAPESLPTKLDLKNHPTKELPPTPMQFAAQPRRAAAPSATSSAESRPAPMPPTPAEPANVQPPAASKLKLQPKPVAANLEPAPPPAVPSAIAKAEPRDQDPSQRSETPDGFASTDGARSDGISVPTLQMDLDSATLQRLLDQGQAVLLAGVGSGDQTGTQRVALSAGQNFPQGRFVDLTEAEAKRLSHRRLRLDPATYPWFPTAALDLRLRLRGLDSQGYSIRFDSRIDQGFVRDQLAVTKAVGVDLKAETQRHVNVTTRASLRFCRNEVTLRFTEIAVGSKDVREAPPPTPQAADCDGT
jgi:hypothetical protein